MYTLHIKNEFTLFDHCHFLTIEIFDCEKLKKFTINQNLANEAPVFYKIINV